MSKSPKDDGQSWLHLIQDTPDGTEAGQLVFFCGLLHLSIILKRTTGVNMTMVFVCKACFQKRCPSVLTCLSVSSPSQLPTLCVLLRFKERTEPSC